MNLLEVRNVTKAFGSLVAVSDVSLNVSPGELRAVIGPNGAGKTTFFNLISGYVSPNCRPGRLRRQGRDEAAASPPSRDGMARTFQITEIFPEVTVRENVRIAVEVAAGLPPAPVDRSRANRRGKQTRGRSARADRDLPTKRIGWWAS